MGVHSHNRYWPLLLLSFFLLYSPRPAWPRDPPQIWEIALNGDIGPATGAYFHRWFSRVPQERPALIVLTINTPGGLEVSMRAIVRDILASPVPVVGFVSPGGARAASAGTYILYACPIAAMAPGTNLGAATPIRIGGLSLPSGEKEGQHPAQAPGRPLSGAATLSHKIVNDAAAFIRSLAQTEGRNGDWAETAVRQAATLSAPDALKLHVITLMADGLPSLLNQIDGRTVTLGGVPTTIHAKGLPVRLIRPDWGDRFLGVVGNPELAYLLMLLGIAGIVFEFAHPGFVLPGTVGLLSLAVALYAFEILPVNAFGVVLILAGAVSMIAEAVLTTFGVLGIVGFVSFLAGSFLLFHSGSSRYTLAWPLLGTLSLAMAGFLIGFVGMAVKARRRPVESGADHLMTQGGEAFEDFETKGRIRINSEIWWATTSAPVRKGQKVRVTGKNGLTLFVTPATEE